MKPLTLYVDKKSFIHAVDPITKLFYLAFAVLTPVFAPIAYASLICALLSLFLLFWAKVLGNALPAFLFVCFVLLTVIVIQGLFGVSNKTEMFRLSGLIFYQEGLLTGVRVILRVVNIVAAFLVLTLTARTSDLAEDLVRAGLSPRIGYVITSVFQIIPQMISSADTIMDAQRSRGMETEGGLIVRMKAFIPLIGPVVLDSFMGTKERALALEARAFSASNKKTFLRERPVSPYASPIRWTFAALMLAALIWRVAA
ncbi:MAG: energy-coupling factor transporter transmembrane protein EcfT [Clostridiales bacterium]|jgi:energy-coupling factor transport system permease protein|nr:energy-coupling factor transporter transmembrane protein EcfT [Clostridiales bacterium]